jgi:lambda family phage minor tail protein L
VAKGIKKEIIKEIDSINQTAIIELFRLYYNYQEDPQAVLHFHGGTNNLRSSIYFDDQEYLPLPLETEGFEVLGDQRLPRPKIKISNAGLYISSMLRKYKNLNGAKIERRRIFAKYLDDRNFDGGKNPWGSANPNARMPDDKYFISQKTAENKLFVEFELVSSLELENNYIPAREVASRYCVWIYRGQGCRYGIGSKDISGGVNSDGQDRPVADINNNLFVIIDESPFPTNGLIMYLDASNSESYSGSGTTWTDLSSGENNGTLQNGVEYSSDHGGVLTFNGTDQYVSTSVNIDANPCSIGARFKASTVSLERMILSTDNGGWDKGFQIINGVFHVNAGNSLETTGVSAEENVWYFVFVTYSNSDVIFYLNGERKWNKGSAPGSSTGSNLEIGRADFDGGGRYFDGKIQKVYVYDRELTEAEIEQSAHSIYKLNPEIFTESTKGNRDFIFSQNSSQGCLVNKGVWAQGVSYEAGDYVYIRSKRIESGQELTANFNKNQNVYYVCKKNHTSSASSNPILDKEKWVKDACSKKLSGCKIRFSNEEYQSLVDGYDSLNNRAWLPFGGFPGTDLYEY